VPGCLSQTRRASFRIFNPRLERRLCFCSINGRTISLIHRDSLTYANQEWKIATVHNKRLTLPDALQVKIKDQGRVSNKALYLAISVNLHGIKEVRGMWADQAHFTLLES